MISVIICTYNPDRAILERVLGALNAQTLSANSWELLLVDSKSTNGVPGEADLSCFREARLIRMEEAGLTPARIAGSESVRGDLLIYVDDDNVLAPDYLERCEALSRQYPDIGVFSASIEAELEGAPSVEMEPYWLYLAVRPLQRDYWANLPAPHVWPIGAGMVVRRAVMTHYIELLRRDPRRKAFDRIGKSLEASGDTDIGAAAFDLGFGCGAFHTLNLRHIIRKHRLERNYLHDLVRSVSRSSVRFEFLFSGRSVGLGDWAKLGVQTAKLLLSGEKGEAKSVRLCAMKGRAEALWQLWGHRL